MRYKATIVAFVEAESYKEAVGIVDYRLTSPLRWFTNGVSINAVKPARIDVQLKGESE